MTERSRYQEGIIRRGYEHRDTIALQRLGEIVSDLYLASGGQANRLWSNAKAALDKVAADDPQAAKILKERKVEALAQFLNMLVRESKQQAQTSAREQALHPPSVPSRDDDAPNGDAQNDTAAAGDALAASASSSAHTPAPAEPVMTLREQLAARAAAEATTTSLDPEQLKRAMKAFRKRLKLKRLDDESKLGRSPLTSGKQAPKMAILPPNEYPAPLWKELARQGKLKARGGGFYELVE